MSYTRENGWWTEGQIAAAALPGLPGTQQGVNRIVLTQGWREREGFARHLASRGWVYHETLFPTAARTALALRQTERAAAAASGDAVPDEAALAEEDLGRALWGRFERLTDAQRAVAWERVAVLRTVRRLLEAGHNQQQAVTAASAVHEVGVSTIYSWIGKVRHIRRADWWAPALADGRTVAKRAPERAEMDEDAWKAFLGDWLRPERASLESCWRRTAELAVVQGWVWPGSRAVRRRIEREIPREAIVLLRDGRDALKKLYPSQVRDRSALSALEAVNADGHRFDVFVEWPDGAVRRPVMIAWQDIYSGKILSWRVDVEENRVQAAMSFGDMVEQYGIPVHAVVDNGRAYACKAMTGGVPTRYRFKVRDNDPVGMLTQMEVQVHWATPYSGQSKPIERAFRDFCDDIAKHPAFAGAYVGNRPDAKPENYGSRAVALDDFLKVLAQGIAAHNARTGRRGGVCEGRSFDEVFAESYGTTPIRKATEEQRRLWLMGAEGVRAQREDGAIEFLGNRYWGEKSGLWAGERVTIRFDWQDLHRPVHVYSLSGAYLGEAPCFEKGRFFGFADAQAHNRARRAWMKAQATAAEALERLHVSEVAALHARIARPDATPPEARIVKPRFGNGAALAARAVAEAYEEIDEIDVARARALHDRGVLMLYAPRPE